MTEKKVRPPFLRTTNAFVHPADEDDISKLKAKIQKSESRVTEFENKNNDPIPRSGWFFLISFSKEISVGGVKYIGEPSIGIIRRLFWLLVVLTGFAALSYQISNSVTSYRSYLSNTNQDVIYTTSLTFPAVTVCNFNEMKKSLVDELYGDGVTTLIDAMYPTIVAEHLPNFTNYNYEGFDMAAFMDSLAHPIDEMVTHCTWKEVECTSHNFTKVYTDDGVCYTFNALSTADAEPLTVQARGYRFALRLILDVEQWDYMTSLTDVAGFRIAIHDHNDIPRVQDVGFAISPGMVAYVALNQIKYTNLPPPHGQCRERELKYYSKYSQNACQTECETDYLVNQCNCREFYMPGNASMCNPQELYECATPALRTFANRGVETCDCPVPCSRTIYKYSMSSAKMSNGYLNSVASNYNYTLEYMRNNYAGVLMYYEDLSYQDITQQEAYHMYQVWCDIGGSMGLLLGGSIITLVELLDFCVVALFRKCLGR
ncbi:acid-sensing ion channel 2-like [Glandiceps talaboti]